MRNIATAMALTAALLLAACTNDEPAPQPSEPVKIDECDQDDGVECK